jgi:mannose-1-phosphate guanylyltransferase
VTAQAEAGPRDREVVRARAATLESAVILVGGQGTRLRPLTEDTPKPMLPLLGRPLLDYTFEQLREAGVRRVVLACGYMPTQIRDHFGDEVGGLEIEYRVEPEPLGTGGAARFAAAGLDETFLLLNGDSLREVDLAALVRLHRERQAAATILLTRVDDPSRYGLVRIAEDGRVRGFVEKPDPSEIDTDLINAGLYVLEPDVVASIPAGRPVSIEREVFPALAAEERLYATVSEGYWIDVGTVSSYLQAHFDLLERRSGPHVAPTAVVADDSTLNDTVFVDESAEVETGARLGPLAYVGKGARIGSGARVSQAVVLPGAVVEAGAEIDSAIVTPDAGVVRP